MDLSGLPIEDGFRLRGAQVTRVETFATSRHSPRSFHTRTVSPSETSRARASSYG